MEFPYDYLGLLADGEPFDEDRFVWPVVRRGDPTRLVLKVFHVAGAREDDPDYAEQRRAFMGAFDVQRRAWEASREYWARVFESGEVRGIPERGIPAGNFVVLERLSHSLTDFLHSPADERTLRVVVGGVAGALSTLGTVARNRGHGKLQASNVLLRVGDKGEPRGVALSDIRRDPGDPVVDVNRLGELICQLVTGRRRERRPPDQVNESWRRLSEPEWWHGLATQLCAAVNPGDPPRLISTITSKLGVASGGSASTGQAQSPRPAPVRVDPAPQPPPPRPAPPPETPKIETVERAPEPEAKAPGALPAVPPVPPTPAPPPPKERFRLEGELGCLLLTGEDRRDYGEEDKRSIAELTARVQEEFRRIQAAQGEIGKLLGRPDVVLARVFEAISAEFESAKAPEVGSGSSAMELLKSARDAHAVGRAALERAVAVLRAPAGEGRPIGERFDLDEFRASAWYQRLTRGSVGVRVADLAAWGEQLAVFARAVKPRVAPFEEAMSAALAEGVNWAAEDSTARWQSAVDKARSEYERAPEMSQRIAQGLKREAQKIREQERSEKQLPEPQATSADSTAGSRERAVTRDASGSPTETPVPRRSKTLVYVGAGVALIGVGILAAVLIPGKAQPQRSFEQEFAAQIASAKGVGITDLTARFGERYRANMPSDELEKIRRDIESAIDAERKRSGAQGASEGGQGQGTKDGRVDSTTGTGAEKGVGRSSETGSSEAKGGTGTREEEKLRELSQRTFSNANAPQSVLGRWAKFREDQIKFHANGGITAEELEKRLDGEDTRLKSLLEEYERSQKIDLVATENAGVGIDQWRAGLTVETPDAVRDRVIANDGSDAESLAAEMRTRNGVVEKFNRAASAWASAHQRLLGGEVVSSSGDPSTGGTLAEIAEAARLLGEIKVERTNWGDFARVAANAPLVAQGGQGADLEKEAVLTLGPMYPVSTWRTALARALDGGRGNPDWGMVTGVLFGEQQWVKAARDQLPAEARREVVASLSVALNSRPPADEAEHDQLLENVEPLLGAGIDPQYPVLRANRLLRQARRENPTQRTPLLESLAEALGAVAATERDQLTSAWEPKAGVAPVPVGWSKVDGEIDGRQPVVLSWGAAQARFVPVAGGTYLATDELSVGLLAEIVKNRQPSEIGFLRTLANDVASGKDNFALGWLVRQGAVQAALTPRGGRDLPPWIGAPDWRNDPAAVGFLQRLRGAVPSPSNNSPVQGLSVQAAGAIARLASMELPGPNAWAAGLDRNQGPGNFLDQSWPVPFPGGADALVIGTYGAPDLNQPLDGNDRVMWFADVDPTSAEFRNMLGNVAEPLSDGSVRGGSAFVRSANSREAASAVNRSQAYADLGVRLAFTPVYPVAVQPETAIPAALKQIRLVVPAAAGAP